jgi:putative sterol carrier protein
MAILFGTDEWLDAFMNRLNEDEKYKQLAANYEGALVFRCYADPSVHEILAKDRVFYFDPYRGSIREWRVCEPGEQVEATYELSGSYPAWKDICTGKLDIKKAVLMTRQIKVKGKISDLVRNITAAERIIEVLKNMQGEYVFPDEIEVDSAIG